ncbi:predicted protein [Nematostella vectensis]|uniref:G-protein coupled receptors family 1 profile domain-containing protein n=1 Tax=Nematostella vectensis TaxID=45351 RepID=A7SHP0_NEMVE|nr:predicted protein [Nematostella vectensis]|eukprot:XP_001628832.1 predicted protein [Nematostella vectensis]
MNQTQCFDILSRSSATELFFLCLCVVVGVTGAVGNGLLLVAVYKTPRLQSIAVLYLCSLSVADFIASVLVAPLLINRARAPHCDYDWKETVFEKIFDFCLFQTVGASSLNLCAVNIDRYINIKYPLHYWNIMNSKTCLWSLAVLWVTSFLVASPSLFTTGKSIEWYWILYALAALVLPMIVIIFCSSEILKITREQLRRISPSLRNRHQGFAIRVRKNRKAIMTFVIITIVYLVSFTPNLICCFIYFFTPFPKRGISMPGYFLWSELFLLTSSSLNPIIYASRNRDFTAAFQHLYGIKAHREHRVSNQSITPAL